MACSGLRIWKYWGEYIAFPLISIQMKLLRNIHLGTLNCLNGNGNISNENAMPTSFLPLYFESRPLFAVSIATFELEIHQKTRTIPVAAIFIRLWKAQSLHHRYLSFFTRISVWFAINSRKSKVIRFVRSGEICVQRLI